MDLTDLIRLSRRYGADPEWVLAGGGNTSCKDDKNLYVKASGHAMATIGEDGFARMDREALGRIWVTDYPPDQAEREAAALKDLMAARIPGEEKRPSVETLMHELIPYRYVVHTHPSVVNGLTCATDGAVWAERLFGSTALWADAIEPGYILALDLRERSQAFTTLHGSFPRIILMQNHGLVVASDDPEEIVTLHDQVRSVMIDAGVRVPDLSDDPVDESIQGQWARAISEVMDPPAIEFLRNKEIARFVSDSASFAPIRQAFTPDHIVYSGARAVWIDSNLDDAPRSLSKALDEYNHFPGGRPRIIAVAGLGVFGCADTVPAVQTALALFLDQVKIATYGERFGGTQPLSDYLTQFILGWEVEHYRQSVKEKGEGDE